MWAYYTDLEVIGSFDTEISCYEAARRSGLDDSQFKVAFSENCLHADFIKSIDDVPNGKTGWVLENGSPVFWINEREAFAEARKKLLSIQFDRYQADAFSDISTERFESSANLEVEYEYAEGVMKATGFGALYEEIMKLHRTAEEIIHAAHQKARKLTEADVKAWKENRISSRLNAGDADPRDAKRLMQEAGLDDVIFDGMHGLALLALIKRKVASSLADQKESFDALK